ncbi:MAG: energy transducer TonB [Deltaproteobacteria bacterium]|nr:energy transducer TonB [Deltaproteobacteria bacterium]
MSRGKELSPGRYWILAFYLCLCLLPSLAQGATVQTRVSLLIGFPEAESEMAEEGSLLVPGTVIPLDVGTRPLAADADSLLASSHQLALLRSKLAMSLRLASLEFAYTQVLSLELGEELPLEGPSSESPVSLQIELLGHNASTASYRVKLFDGSEVIANSPLTLERGASAVVGGLDGDDAPYIFLVVSVLEEFIPGGPLKITDDIVPPRAIFKDPPQYTEEARKEGVEGLVILQAVIDKAGEVREVKILKSLSNSLDEAAVDAIRQWRFEPATLDGVAVDVYYNLTINFTLPDKNKES